MDSFPSVHSGNYYTTGAARVAAKLQSMGFQLTAETVTPTNIDVFSGGREMMTKFSPLELALLDHFEGRDYTVAQALVHPGQSPVWHSITVHCDDAYAGDLSEFTLAPSLVDALVVLLAACEDRLNPLHLEQFGQGIHLYSETTLLAVVEPVPFEPFSLENRNRVRAALKHLRYHGADAQLIARLRKLPGFATSPISFFLSRQRTPSCRLLGFPANWAGAMREALAQVGVNVALNQAQELAAVFFGAGDWHQLIVRQDQALSVTPGVVCIDEAGTLKRRFYHTPEEALLATGQLLAMWPEPLVVDEVRLSISQEHLLVRCCRAQDHETQQNSRAYAAPAVISNGFDDIYDRSYFRDEDELVLRAQELLAAA